MIRLHSQINNFTNVLHIGDIHIRLTQRHQEYVEAFDKLYASIDKTPHTTAILVAGDIFHNKSDLSPESIKIASNFLKNLADRRPTILIAGNHDATLANKNRLDSLSPLVDALNHKNLYYLKETECYIIGDILFNNYGVFDDPDKYIKYKDIPAIYRNEVNYNIALFHGPVNNAVTDVGYIVSSRTIMADTFDGHQMVMLGDIHKHQILQEYNHADDKPVIVYCGSLLQQDHGEELLGHGFVYWELKSKKFVHVEIPNDYGFYTIEVNKGVLSTDINNIPKKAKLRIKCTESIPSEIKSVLSDIRNVSNITEVSYIRVDEAAYNKNIIDATDFNLQNVADIDYQNNLIKEYIKNKKVTISDDTLECIYALNKELNNALTKEYISKNIRWKPKIFKFDNMFSYGENNIIDFSKMNGSMGLFANNASGKSSILSALSFCLFDKCDRAFKASHVLNSQKMTFRCEFNFEINGVDFFIERKGVSDKKGAVKVDVKFWKTVDGKDIELNGEARRSTNDIIRDYIGEYEDFILTVLSIQNGKDGSFVDMGQTERKDLLAQFMGLNIFDKLSGLAMDNYRESSILLKNFNNEDYTIKLNEIQNEIKKLERDIVAQNAAIDETLVAREKHNNALIDLTKKLINIGTEIVDITILEKNKIEQVKKIDGNNFAISVLGGKIDLHERSIISTNNEIARLDGKNIKENLAAYITLKDRHSQLQSRIDTKKIVIKGKLEKLAKLEEHKYDPNCNFCVTNVFVRDAIKTKEELENDKNDVISMMAAFNTTVNELGNLSWVLSENDTYEALIKTRHKLTIELSTLSNDILKEEKLLGQNNTALVQSNHQIEFFYQQKENIENNKVVNDNIREIKSLIKALDDEYKDKNKNLNLSSTSLQINIDRKKLIEENLLKIKELELKNDCYKYYTAAVSRDGIPYDLITQALPTIEKEVNDILHQIVDFTISLKTDGKNVSSYISYDDKKWPLEMSSGMEKFVSSLAIRVALVNISNLPRPNFIAIDEGFGCADKENLASMSTLFVYLKSQFDFIWIISHLDEMRDMVDKQIEIKKESGFSKIVFI